MFGRMKERFRRVKKLAKGQPRVLHFEELEPRVLFSADVMPGLDFLAVDEQLLAEDVTKADQLEYPVAPATVEQTAAEARSELVIVNPNFTDHEQLTADLQIDDNSRIIEVVVLEADRDGIIQVSEILTDHSDLAAVHFITHGADGQINLGNSWLNSHSLQQNSEGIAGWGRALTGKGDFLFYGCNIAADNPGQALLKDIARLTGADVAASDDLTGQAQIGGDWVLEYDQGNIETALAINSATQQNWNGVLTPSTVNTTFYLAGAGDGSDIPTAALKVAAPVDTTLDNFDPGRDSMAGLLLNKSDEGIEEDDTENYQQWLAAPGAIKLNGPAYLSLWSAMKDFDMSKAGSITAFLVDSNATGNDLTEIANATIRRADWDAANTGTWIEDTFDFGTVDYTLDADRCLGVKIVVDDDHSGDDMWLAYDAVSNPSRLTVTRVSNTAPSGSVTIDNTNPAQGDVLTASNILADADGLSGPISYQWQRDGENIVGATGDTYTTIQADVGTVITVVASYTDDLGYDESVSSAGTEKVINVNDAPVLGNNNLSISEGATVTLDSSMLSATDADHPDSSLIFNVSGVTGGQFVFTSDPATAITSFDQSDISASKVAFVHDGHETQPGYSISVTDGSDSTAAMPANITFTNQNDAPLLGNNSLTISEGATVVLDSSMLSASDADNTDSELTFNISAVNGGQFERVSTGLAITAFTPTEVAAGQVRFVHDGSQTAPSYDVSVTDGSASTGPVPATIDFTNVNDAPVLGNNNLSISEGATVTLDSSMLSATDADHPDSSLIFNVSGVTGGQFVFTSDPATAITSFDQSDISASKVAFVHDGHETQPGYSISVTDGSDSTAAMPANITFTNQNDAPLLGNNSLTISEGATVVLDSSMLSASDADNTDSELTFNISAVNAGQFERVSTGLAITAFTPTEVAAGQVRFVHDGSQTAPSYDVSVTDGSASTGPVPATINFTNINDPGTLTINNTTPVEGDTLTASVADPDGATGAITYQWYRDGVAIGGAGAADYTTSQADVGKVMTVTADYTDDLSVVENLSSGGTAAVTNVNDAPVLGNNNLVITGSATVTLDSSMLSASDADHPDSSLTFNVSGVTGGHFALSSDPATPINSFDNSDITAGNVVFIHNGSETQPGYSISVTDGTDSTAAMPASITYTDQNDDSPPSIDFLTLPENPADSPDNATPSATDEIKSDPPVPSHKPGVSAGQLSSSNDTVISLTGLDRGEMADGTVVFIQDGNQVSTANRMEFRRVEFERIDDKPRSYRTYFSYQRLKLLLDAQNFGELKAALGNLNVSTLSSSDYELVRDSLDAIKEEIGTEIMLGKTVLGSAMAATIGLSAGYVVWLLKGGSLLASVLSSLPAWQLADPLAILVGQKGDDDNEEEDDESLETIIDDSPKRHEGRKSKDSEQNDVKNESNNQ